MDIATLKVGQRVTMISGCYCEFGTVAKVTPSGVEIQIAERVDEFTIGEQRIVMQRAQELLYFDSNGRQINTSPIPGSWIGTYECGAWELDDPTTK